MTPRANWKGWICLGEIAFAVALHTAATTSDCVSLHMINRVSGHRLTAEPVDDEDEVMGYELDSGDHVLLTLEEIAAAVPRSDKAIAIEAFLPCRDIDTLYLDRPHYLSPADPASVEAFTLLRESMEYQKVATLSRTVLFRRWRGVLISRPMAHQQNQQLWQNGAVHGGRIFDPFEINGLGVGVQAL